MLRPRRATSTLVLASLLAGCATAPDVVPARALPPDDADVLVMTFNVHRDESGDAATLEAIGAPRADVVCLQEVTPAWERALRARWAGAYPYAVFHADAGYDGLAVLSRFPLEDRGVDRLSDWHPAMRVVARTAAGPLQIVNVHLRATFDGGPDPLDSWARTPDDHVTQMALSGDRLAPRVPAIVAGDLNEGEQGSAVHWLEARGFRDALPRFHAGQHTWRGRSLLGGVVLTTDHVLATRPLVAVDAWLPPRGRSDHMPIVARFHATQDWRAR